MPISKEGGAAVDAKAGDVVNFGEGGEITVISDLSGRGFYCGQRKIDEV